MLSVYVGVEACRWQVWASTMVPPKLAHVGGAAAAGQPTKTTRTAVASTAAAIR